MQTFFLFIKRWGFLMLLAFCIGSVAHGQIFNRPNKTVPPADPGFPTPIKAKVKALKGKQLIIELSADTKTPSSIVEFLIRDFPLAGTIDSLVSKPKDRSKAIMKYTPKLNTAATTDVFTFSVRYPKGRWSAAAKVEIALVDAVPIMQAPQIVEFGRVMIGDESVKEIYVQNKGNALYDKTLKLAAPWHVISPKNGKLTVPIGGSKIIKIAYRPIRQDKTKFQFTINRNAGGMPELHAEGYVPFSFEKPIVTLQPNTDRGTREAEIVVLSHAPKTLMLKLRKSDRVTLDNQTTEIYLSPGKKSKIPITLPSTDAAAFEGTLELSTETGFLQNATLKAAKLPGRLKIEIPGAVGSALINLGEVNAGQKLQGGLIVKNVGGDPINVEIELPPPFKILGNGPGRLAPQTAQPLPISFEPTETESGLFDETLTLRTATQEIEVRLLAISKRKATPQEPKMRIEGFNSNISNNSTGQPRINKKSQQQQQVGNTPTTDQVNAAIAEMNKLSSVSGFITTALKERRVAENLPAPTGFTLEVIKPTELTIGWQAPPNTNNHEFELELRGERTNKKTHRLDSVWVPITNTEFHREGDFVTARVQGLTPYSLYEFRAFTINPNGHSSAPSPPFGIATPLPMDWTWIYLGTGIFLALFIVIFGTVRIVKQRRADGNGFVDPIDF